MEDNRNIKEIVSSLRHDFSKETLDESAARKDPFEQFELWFTEAVEKKLHEPNAMVLATATAKGKPSSRVVLLRGFDAEGFTFYTNYDSRKGEEIAANPQASLLFYWPEIAKQARIEGSVERADEKISDAYFASRPRASQLGALASSQSSVIKDRNELEKEYARLEKELSGQEIKRPANWGGYVLKPEMFEFWQGRESRLHDRLSYTKNVSGWEIRRLAP